MKILHCFADRGAECETLSRYGDVIRIGIDAKPNESSTAIKADAHNLPFSNDTRFEIGVFHPPCTRWSNMPDANKNGDAPNLIPLAREIAAEHCEHWIIENKPTAPLNDPVILNGKMFGLPIVWERAFETSFPVEQPPRQQALDTETSPFFYSNRSREWWAAVKGSSTDYPKEHLAKNTIPAAYLDFLMQNHAKAQDPAERGKYVDRDRYDEYDKEMDKRRSEETNEQLTRYQ